MAAVDGPISLRSMNFSEKNYVFNGSLITPSKFDARFLKASESKFYWSGSFEELIDFGVYLNVKRDTAKLSVRKWNQEYY